MKQVHWSDYLSIKLVSRKSNDSVCIKRPIDNHDYYHESRAKKWQDHQTNLEVPNKNNVINNEQVISIIPASSLTPINTDTQQLPNTKETELENTPEEGQHKKNINDNVHRGDLAESETALRTTSCHNR